VFFDLEIRTAATGDANGNAALVLALLMIILARRPNSGESGLSYDLSAERHLSRWCATTLVQRPKTANSLALAVGIMQKQELPSFLPKSRG
jgi:hypothetical protein